MIKSARRTSLSKAFVVLGLLIITVLYIVNKGEARAVAGPSLEFSESSKAVSAGDSFTAKIIVDTGGQEVFGAGAKLTFDPEILEVVSIQPGSIFGDYPVASYDNATGNIVVSGISSSKNNSFNDIGEFATVAFRAKSQGETSVSYIFEPGSTRDSNLAVTYGNGDILSQVSNLSVTVTPAVGGLQVASVANVTQSQEPIRLSFFERLLRFLGLSSEPEYVREGRQASGSIDARDPIPSQPPITDPNQRQPVSVIGPTNDSLASRFVKIFFAGALVVGVVLMIKRFLIKSKNKKATVFQNIDNNQSNKV